MATQEELEIQTKEQEKKIEDLTLLLADAGKDGDQVLRTQMADLTKKNDELIQQRQARKKKDEDAELERLAEQGEFKTLAEQSKEEALKLAKDVEEKDILLGKYKERDEAEFAKILETVPEEMRETISDETLPLSKRLDLARKLAVVKPASVVARIAGENTADSLEEKLRLATERGDIGAQISLKNEIFAIKKE